VFVAAMMLGCGAVALAQGPTYKLGRPATEQELNRLGAIAPDGTGLPPGSGTAAQGAILYVARGCSVCHGPTGAEGPAPHLVGKPGAGNPIYDTHYEGGNWRGRGVANFFFAPMLWGWINEAMPLNRQGYLTPDEVYSLTAYLLYRNDIIQEGDVMDAKSLPQVRMPGRDLYAPPPFSEWKPGLPRTRSK